MKQTQSESKIQRAILDYLSFNKNIMFWRNNTIPVYDPVRKSFRSIGKYALNGLPDIIVVKDGKFIGLEVKTPKGVQSGSQQNVERRLKDNGAEYYLVRNIDDVQKLGL